MKVITENSLTYMADWFFKNQAQKNVYSLKDWERKHIEERIAAEHPNGIDIKELEKMFSGARFEKTKDKYLNIW